MLKLFILVTVHKAVLNPPAPYLAVHSPPQILLKVLVEAA